MNDKSPQPTSGAIIKAYLDKGDPTGWFEVIYANAQNGGSIPWAYQEANPYFVEWAEREKLNGEGKRALVIGCGLGDDAEYLATLGFAVVAFDIAPTAIAMCKARFPDSKVDYQVIDLFQMPDHWAGTFDFVLESHTLQSLPWQMTDSAIAAIARAVASQGTLLVLCIGREPEENKRGIPWPLSRVELAGFLAQGLTEAQFEVFHDTVARRRFRVTYRKM